MNGLIKNWRDEWGLGDFPFYFVQLAPNGSLGQGNGTSQAFLREAQLKTMLCKKYRDGSNIRYWKYNNKSPTRKTFNWKKTCILGISQKLWF